MSIVVTLSPKRIRWPRRGVVYLFLLGWVVVTGWLVYDKWGGRVRLMRSMLAAQKAVFETETPAELALETDEAAIKTLLAEPQYSAFRNLFATDDSVQVAVLDSAERRLTAFDWTLDSVKVWEASQIRPPKKPKTTGGLFGGGGGLFGPSGGGTTAPTQPDASAAIFSHRRTAPGGPSRLLAVRAKMYDGPKHVVKFNVEFWSSGTLWSPPGNLGEVPLTRPGGEEFQIPGIERLFTGTIDSTDPSRFLFDYEIHKTRGTFEGRLLADGSVKISVLSGPARESGQGVAKLP